MTKSNTAYAYTRVSTENQCKEDKYGLETQLKDIQAFAKQNNIQIIEQFTDAGISGAKENRPALNDLLDAVKNNKIDVVIVAKLDRIARDLMFQLWIEKELKKHNVELISVAEPMNSNDATGMLFRQIIGAFAEFEKSRINERMTSGRRQKAQKGKYSGGRPALGYTADKNSKSLVIDNKKADIILLTIDLRAKNLSYEAIASKLNSLGHTTALNKQFTKMQVKRICDRKELYQGNYSYSGIQTIGQHQAIIV